MKTPPLGRNLSIYLSDAGRYPLIDAKQEQRLARKYRTTGDRRFAQTLVISNLRFVVKVALQYRHYGLQPADLIQEGNLGLMRAVEKFDPRRGLRLISYAIWWIRAYIQSYILRCWSLVKIGTTQVQRRLFYSLSRVHREIERLGGGDAFQDSVEELAQRLHVKPQEVVDMQQRLSGRDLSLDTPSSDDGPPLLNLVPGFDQPIDEKLADAQISNLLVNRVAQSMADLNPRERFIIQRRVFDEKPATFHDLGEHFGISRERARQLERRAKEKLRGSLGSSLFKPDSEDLSGQCFSDLLKHRLPVPSPKLLEERFAAEGAGRRPSVGSLRE